MLSNEEYNEMFIKDIKNNMGSEGFEEFQESELGEKFKEYYNGGINLSLMIDVIAIIKNELTNIKNMGVVDSFLLGVIIRELIFSNIIKMSNKKLYGDLLEILEIITDGFIEQLLSYKETEEG